MATAKVTPKITSVTVNYNASIKANLEKLGAQYKYESMQVSDSESRTYDVTGMDEAEVDKFADAIREVLKEKIDERVMAGYAEIFE